jgi:hypothetical protein
VAAATLLVLIGACGMTYALLMAQGRRFMADAEIGRGLTLLNCACFLGAAVLQGLSGLVVDGALSLGVSEAGAYRWLFVFLAVYLAAALAAYLPSGDRPPRPSGVRPA